MIGFRGILFTEQVGNIAWELLWLSVGCMHNQWQPGPLIPILYIWVSGTSYVDVVFHFCDKGIADWKSITLKEKSPVLLRSCNSQRNILAINHILTMSGFLFGNLYKLQCMHRTSVLHFYRCICWYSLMNVGKTLGLGQSSVSMLEHPPRHGCTRRHFWLSL